MRKFEQFVSSGTAARELAQIRQEADAEGVFGVPSFVIEKELFFGNDRIDWVEKRLRALGLAKSSL